MKKICNIKNNFEKNLMKNDELFLLANGLFYQQQQFIVDNDLIKVEKDKLANVIVKKMKKT